MKLSDISWNCKSICILLTFILMTGCATILDGNNQKLTFSSSPSGATVKINGEEEGKTPLSIKRLREDESLRIEISKPGYETAERTIVGNFNNRVVSNIGFGSYGITSAGVDFLTQNPLYQYKPSGIHASLKRQAASLQQKREFQERERLRKFVLTAYPSLVTQIKQGSGPYLDTLVNQLDRQDTNIVDKIQNKLDNSQNRLHFAKLLLEELYPA